MIDEIRLRIAKARDDYLNGKPMLEVAPQYDFRCDVLSTKAEADNWLGKRQALSMGTKTSEAAVLTPAQRFDMILASLEEIIRTKVEGLHSGNDGVGISSVRAIELRYLIHAARDCYQARQLLAGNHGGIQAPPVSIPDFADPAQLNGTDGDSRFE